MNDQERLELDLWIERVVFEREWTLHERVKINKRWVEYPTYLLKLEDPANPPPGAYAGSRPCQHSIESSLAITLLGILSERTDSRFVVAQQKGAWFIAKASPPFNDVLGATFPEAVAQLAKAVFS